MSKVSIGILTYNRREAVLRAIRSAYEQDIDDVEVVVVDSNSSDGTIDAIRAAYPDVKLIRLPRNLGCPGGRNHVFANCEGDYIVSLDDDGFLAEGALPKLIDVFDSDEKIGIVALRQCYVDEPDDGRIVGAGALDVGTFHGGVSAQRRSMLEQIGYYPEDFFLYAEESYLALKALDAGWRIVAEPSIVMWHPRLGPSGGSGTKWDYYRFRNRMLVVTRLFPGWLMLKYLILRMGSYALASLRRGSPIQFIRALSHVVWTLPGTLWRRTPCKAAAVRAHLRMSRLGAS